MNDTYTVLVVDDMPWNCEQARRDLTHPQIDLKVACGLSDGLAAMRQSSQLDLAVVGMWFRTPPEGTNGNWLGIRRMGTRTPGDPLTDVLIPAGPSLGLIALARGARNFVVFSDGDHHSDRLTRLLDAVNFPSTSVLREARQHNHGYWNVDRNRRCTPDEAAAIGRTWEQNQCRGHCPFIKNYEWAIGAVG